jgi:D-sedoheptulose 7-phosphate isomerase
MTKEERILKLKKLAEETTILRKSMVEKLGPEIIDLAAVISGVIGAGGKLLLAGNGGSAADASHFAAEMIVRLSSERNRQSLPAIALNTDTSILTAAANDFGFENIFARQVEGLGHKGDMLLVISTSGNSANLIKAVQTSKDSGIISAALLGGNGGKLAKIIDRSLIVPHPSTQRVQEEHIFIIHALVELIESDLLNAR